MNHDRPFKSSPAHFGTNSRPAIVSPALLTNDTGEQHPGLHLAQGRGFMIITHENAIRLANDIVDTIEATRAEQRTTS